MSITSLINQEKLSSLVEQDSLFQLVDSTNQTVLEDPFSELRVNVSQNQCHETIDEKNVNESIINKRKINFPFKITFSSSFKAGIKMGWFALSSFAGIALTLALIYNPNLLSSKEEPKYSIYSAKPMVAGITTAGISNSDARGSKIDEIFRKYNCPIQGMGDVFVREADKNDIPYWMVAAVAFQESSCGKFTPKSGGEESSNLWGWGVWGDHIYMFEDVEEGIEVVSKYMNDRFYSQGITDPCVIMKTYTPPSDGSWCRGVKFFRDQIMDYTSPPEE